MTFLAQTNRFPTYISPRFQIWNLLSHLRLPNDLKIENILIWDFVFATENILSHFYGRNQT